VEIERKFLIGSRPDSLASAPSARLRQGYLVTCAEGEARVREADGECTLTVKSGSGRSRAEAEVAITPEQFRALWPATEGRRIGKTRYRVPLDALVAEVDIYEGTLDGLEIVEVEFASDAQASAFVPPAWFGRDVTLEPGYKNAALATRGLPE
jgi:CYTH domain-containing protein